MEETFDGSLQAFIAVFTQRKGAQEETDEIRRMIDGAVGKKQAMSKLFFKIVNMSVVVGWLILAVIQIRLPLKKAALVITDLEYSDLSTAP